MGAKQTNNFDYEWSFPVAADEINANRPMTYKIVANEKQRLALATRFGIVSLDHAEATLVLSREPGAHIVHVAGSFEVDITQECIISLDPIKSNLTDRFEAFYADPDAAISFKKAKAKREEAAIASYTETQIMDEEDDPEPVVDGQIDLGELSAQYISLAINPYPQKDGVKFQPEKVASSDPFNPFAVLKKLKK